MDKEEQEILFQRVDELISIGFKEIADESGFTYVKNNSRVPANMIMTFRTRHWIEFIEKYRNT